MNENVEPWPGSDSTQIRPPCISMIRFEIAKPEAGAALGLGDRIVGLLEFLEHLASGRPRRCPGPVSRTATVNEPLLGDALIATAPASVNLMALPTRLSSTWVSRRSSPRPVGMFGGNLDLEARASFAAASVSTAP